MRRAASIVVLVILMPPILSRAEDKAPPTFVCSLAISKDGELAECMSVTAPPGNDESLKKVREFCGTMASGMLDEKFKKKNPGISVLVNNLGDCDLSAYYTQCVYPKGKETGAVRTNHFYVLEDALGFKNECVKDQGKWSENPDFKEQLHPPKVTAEQLHAEWRTNQAKAMIERGQKPMALSGRLSRVTVDDDEEVSVILAVTGPNRWVTVLGISNEEAATYKPDMNVNFRRCALTGRTRIWDNPIVTCQ
jgi:hypothetical protein